MRVSVKGCIDTQKSAVDDILDILFRSELFYLDLNATNIKRNYHFNGQETEVTTLITVDGNTVTFDMSNEYSAYRKVDMYMYQDAGDSQLHIYMPTKSFVNYFANLQIPTLIAEGKIAPDDTVAIEKLFADM